MERIQSFSPIVGNAPKVLILGSMPSVKSLEVLEYYGHGRNQFWRIMGDLFGFDQNASYELRKSKIMQQGIAVWDVMQSCERQGSLDKDIKNASYNDVVGFLLTHPSITTVIANGSKARDVYKKQFEQALQHIDFVSYYSTSPANAISYERKLTQWSGILRLLEK